jgi:TonB-linked SusC/RagA family outer membrane protein
MIAIKTKLCSMKKSSLQSSVLVFFLVLELTCLQTPAHGQGLPPARRPLLEVLTELNKTKGVYFLFSQQPLGKVLVNSPVLTPNLPVEKILTQVLKGTGLEYKKVDDRTFVIIDLKSPDRNNSYDLPPGTPDTSSENPGLVAGEELSRAGGRVTTADGKALQGVSITVKDTRKGTVTDLAGRFDILASPKDTLLFSFVGYKPFKAAAGKVEGGNIVLDPSDEPLMEVMVTALGIRKQERSLGYSATEVDGSMLTQSREVNLGNALVGQVAGLSVAVNGTGPYGSSRLTIRGNASLSGNNQPLYVIDGVPYDNSTPSYASQYGGADMGDGLSNINPDDIEKVLVLKGVAASALYGYRGGNGAILIQTKSGSKTHGIGVQLNNNFTFNEAVDERDYQYTYGQGLSGIKPVNSEMALASPYFSWGAKLDGSTAVNFLGIPYPYAPVRDNLQHFLQTGFTNQTSLALTGANSRGHFRMGLTNLGLAAVIPNSTMRQQGLNLNSTYFVTNKLQMDLTADYVFEQIGNRLSLSDNPGNAMAAPMYLANSFDIRWLRDHTIHPDGTEWLPGDSDPYFENPYYIAHDYINSTGRTRLTGGLTLKYNLLDWLYVQGQVARDGYLFNVTSIVPSGVEYTRSDGVHGGNLTQYEVNFHELNGNFMIGFHRKIGSSFSFEGDVGGNRQDNSTIINGIGAVPNSSNRAVGPFLIAGNYNPNDILIKPYSTYNRGYRVNSLYSSVDLAYKNFLFLNMTARSDWFSTLSIQSDHFLYPSVSGSFLFSDAWRMPSWISLGKLRASYATSSNGTEPYQNVLNYQIQSYTVSGQPIGYIATSNQVPQIPNASLRPISISEKEIGVVLQFLKGRVGADITLYDKQTTDDIVKVTVSATSGYNQDILNIGRIRNKGIELLLTGSPVKSPRFTWNSSFNFAVNDNKVLYIGGARSIVITGAYPRWGSEVSISNVVGLPYGQIMGFAYKRDPRGKVIFSDGLSNPAPAGEPEQTGVIPLGTTVYKQTGGLTNDFHYKDFGFSFLVDFKFGAKIYSGTNLLLYYYGLQKSTMAGREMGYVGKGVLENGHPNATAVPAQQYFQDISAGGANHIAEEFVYDASFIKLRSASLVYTVPAAVLKKRFIKGISVSLVGRNLAILLKHVPNIDPESSINNTNGQGLELTGYPAVRSWGFNLNLNF